LDHDKIAWWGIEDVQQCGQVLDLGFKTGKGGVLGTQRRSGWFFPEISIAS
jgi:hypothetical protein